MKPNLRKVMLWAIKRDMQCAINNMRCLRRARYKDGDRAHALIETLIESMRANQIMVNDLLELLADDEGK